MDREEPQYYRLLVIDDNPAIHEDFKKLLTQTTPAPHALTEISARLFNDTEEPTFADIYELDHAFQGEEGFLQVQKSLAEKKPYALVFVDVRMPPGWDGLETIQHIWAVDADIQTVICTAFSDYTWSDIVKKLGRSDRLLILKKPFDNLEIRQIAGAMTEKWFLKKIADRQLSEIQRLIADKTTALRQTFSLLRATFDSTMDGILVVKDNKVIDYNRRFVEMWHIPESILDTQEDEKLLHFVLAQLQDPDAFIKKIHELYSHTAAESHDILKFKDGRIFERFSKPQYLGNEIVGRVWDFRDITDRIHLEEKLAHQATHDTLTGLPNRKLIVDRLHMAIGNAKRFQKKFAVLFFDLDRFKLVNDSLGHTIGDRLLEAAAKRLEACVRQTDTVGRLGGDEFVALIEHLDNEKDVLSIVQKILTELSTPFHIANHDLNVTTCIGVSFYPRDGEIAEILFKNADAAMYRAKELGGNNFQFYNNSMHLRAEQRLEMENCLRTALERKEFFIHYQPVINVKTKKISCVEALLRWQHPEKGLIFPTEFIPTAEETNLIIPIGEWVLYEACRQNKAWQTAGLPPIGVSVNLSPLQFRRADMLKTIETVLQKTELSPQYLILEITENLLLAETPEIRKTLDTLRTKGVRFAIDDFGTGYSNLSLVNRYPIDKLKIDRSFLRNFHNNPNDKAIILAIIAMAKSLHLSVVAEGVEELLQLEFLEGNRCDEIQGFYYSEPVAPEKLADMLTGKIALHEKFDSPQGDDS